MSIFYAETGEIMGSIYMSKYVFYYVNKDSYKVMQVTLGRYKFMCETVVILFL